MGWETYDVRHGGNELPSYHRTFIIRHDRFLHHITVNKIQSTYAANLPLVRAHQNATFLTIPIKSITPSISFTNKILYPLAF